MSETGTDDLCKAIDALQKLQQSTQAANDKVLAAVVMTLRSQEKIISQLKQENDELRAVLLKDRGIDIQ